VFWRLPRMLLAGVFGALFSSRGNMSPHQLNRKRTVLAAFVVAFMFQPPAAHEERDFRLPETLERTIVAPRPPEIRRMLETNVLIAVYDKSFLILPERVGQLTGGRFDARPRQVGQDPRSVGLR
jgi:hypothetical protein